MKKIVLTLFFFTLFVSFSTESYAIVAPAPETGVLDAAHARLQKRMQQVKVKLEKKLFKKYKKAAPPQIWEDDRFRLGVIALAAALALALIAGLGILSGFFGFLAGLSAVIGLILIIWALVDGSY